MVYIIIIFYTDFHKKINQLQEILINLGQNSFTILKRILKRSFSLKANGNNCGRAFGKKRIYCKYERIYHLTLPTSQNSKQMRYTCI